MHWGLSNLIRMVGYPIHGCWSSPQRAMPITSKKSRQDDSSSCTYSHGLLSKRIQSRTQKNDSTGSDLICDVYLASLGSIILTCHTSKWFQLHETLRLSITGLPENEEYEITSLLIIDHRVPFEIDMLRHPIVGCCWQTCFTNKVRDGKRKQ